MPRAKRPDKETWDPVAGERMRKLLDRARVNAGVAHLKQLYPLIGIGRDTAQAWMRGERPPSPRGGGRVAKALGMTYAEMMAEYFGAPANLEPRQLIAAFEWAIAQVRAGPPPEVLHDVAQAEKSAARLRRPRARPRGGR